MIPFDKPPVPETAMNYIKDVLHSRNLSGNGLYTKKCQKWFVEKFGAKNCLLTTSGTSALEMAARLGGIESGDEVIMASYTFSSSANAFVMCGAKIVFVDIRPDTLNIDEKLIEKAITHKTKAVVPIHYAGVACEMDEICDLAKRYNLLVIEDAAQGVMSSVNGKKLGTIGNFGCYSFHSTKNYCMGEGGAIIVQDSKIYKQAEIMWEKGTDRVQFMRGEVDKYSWVDWGSSYLPSELNAAYLWSQLEIAETINNDRLKIWNLYYKLLEPLEEDGLLRLPFIPLGCEHNAHMFHIRTKTPEERDGLLKYLKERKIGAVFHYIPLHSSKAGKKHGTFCGKDTFTTSESEKLLRLPLYYGLTQSDIEKTIDAIFEFFKGNRKLL